MDPELARLVRQKLDADREIGGVPRGLVAAACAGEAALASELAGEPAPPAVEEEERGSVGPAGVYLTSLAVEGFRGIGQRAELEFEPGPGLTLITGPNGCGKSSFAEGLEFLLTGATKRWDESPAGLRRWWRNVHHEGSARIEAVFAIEGEGKAVAARHWSGDGLDDSALTFLTSGSPADPGWDDALQRFRPFLSYGELGATLEGKPSDAYDYMSRAISLGALVDARGRLGSARLSIERDHKAAREGRDGLLSALQDVADERALRCREALAGPEWGLDAIGSVIGEPAGSDAPGTLGELHRIAAIKAPDEATARDACDALRRAQDASDTAARSDSGRALARTDLIAAALRFHDHHGDQPCPVCGDGALDASWREEARREEAQLRGEAGEAQEARDELAAVIRSAQELVRPLPDAADAGLLIGVEGAAARAAWDAWRDWPDDGRGDSFAGHVEATLPPLREAAEDLRSQAKAELERRADAWRPLAEQLATWLPKARDALRGQEQSADLRKAESWLQKAEDGIRDERFRRIAEQAKRNWECLRKGSTVDVDDFVLAGRDNQRRLIVDGTVDGTGKVADARAVMSQGELHSLALSLFLPRATLDDSPFRFVAIDDPVQAMDPAKVDGLARVLGDAAAARQVIVFTHDDRLPEAVRRLEIPARQLRIARSHGSVVDVREVADPVSHYLKCAREVASTPGLPPEMARKVIPGFCRSALEAACTESVRRRRIGHGDSHAEVERTLADAHGLKKMLALALFDDLRRERDVWNELKSSYGPLAPAAVDRCNRAVHGDAETGDLKELIRDCDDLASELRRRK